MPWIFNKDYNDLGQVQDFYAGYLAARLQLTSAGQYPYNDSFRGRIPGIVGPDEDTAIYLLQTLRKVREMERQVTARREAGWRDFTPAELDSGPVRYAGIAEYGWYMGGDGFREWGNARLARYGRSVMVLPGRRRTNGHLISGRLLVKD